MLIRKEATEEFEDSGEREQSRKRDHKEVEEDGICNINGIMGFVKIWEITHPLR